MLEWAKRRTTEIMERRRLSPGDLADELGIRRLDASVMTAVHRETKVKSSATRDAVDRWLEANAAV